MQIILKQKSVNMALITVAVLSLFSASACAQTTQPSTDSGKMKSSGNSAASTSQAPSSADTANAAGKSSQKNAGTDSNSSGMSNDGPAKNANQTMPGSMNGTSGTSGMSGTSGSSLPSALSVSDLNFIRQLANANMSEIEAAKLAQEKSKNEKTLSFSREMIEDHNKALDKVKQLAQSKGVELPAEPDSVHKTAEKKLSALSGSAFDRSYMAQAGLADHKKTVALLKRINSEAKDPDLKALSTEMLPEVEKHLQEAQKK